MMTLDYGAISKVRNSLDSNGKYVSFRLLVETSEMPTTILLRMDVSLAHQMAQNLQALSQRANVKKPSRKLKPSLRVVRDD